MATKVALTVALLAALLAIAAATTYTTTVTTTSIEEESSHHRPQCRQLIQGRQFNDCQRFLSQREEREDVLAMTTGNQGRQPQPQQQYVEACCRSLREVDEQGCGCEAISHAAKQVQESGRHQQAGQSQQVYEKAKVLPRICNLRSQQCSFPVLFL